ncbi:D-2-hydroxyacid dehydrogenase [Gammaproteobacteria bacterium]|nr:D-2-hydroxyacid dehydrogenase [Gammaproteobacteria bacterium]
MKILIIPGLTLPSISDTDIERIRVAGGNADVVVSTPEEAIEHVGDSDVLLGLLSKRMFLASNRLKWVHAIASGVDMFLYDEFVLSDVILTSEKGLVGEHLADHAFGLLLMLTRQLGTALRLGPSSWEHRPEMRSKEIELTGATLGIFGFGGTGKAMARRAVGFGMQVIALDREQMQASDGAGEVLAPGGFDSMLSRSDVVSICCPLTTETRGKFNSAAFKAMKDSAVLVNVTRGEVMVEDDLVNALIEGIIAGAALDVAPREPLPADSGLWSLDNVVMSPHTAGASQFRASRNLDRFIRNLERLNNGETLEGVIDKDLGY